MHAHDFQTMYSVEKKHWWFRGKRDIVFDFLFRACGMLENKKILDLGCGTGFFSEPLMRYGAKVVCIDTSNEALAFVRQRGLRDVVLGDALHLPFPDSTFDIVLALDILEHIEDDMKAVQEIKRVLKIGGIALITVPAFPSLYGLNDKRLEHFRRYTKKTLKELLCSLEEQHMTFYNFFLFVPIFLTRFIFKHVKWQGVDEDELKIDIKFINSIFYLLLTIERILLRRFSLPWGVSLLAITQKHP